MFNMKIKMISLSMDDFVHGLESFLDARKKNRVVSKVICLLLEGDGIWEFGFF